MSGLWRALAVRPAEVAHVRRLFIAAVYVGLALVTFFSGSNAIFLDSVGSEALPWVYVANAVLMVIAGLGYAAWSRRASTATVLIASIALLAASVFALWLWAVVADGGEAAGFVLAVWFRFLFIFGFLGLWEIASALFDVRQAKRLFPAVALGSMLAFMIGGAVVSALASVIGTEQLILVSALFWVLYAAAFARAAADVDFDQLDAAPPATPAQILSDRFSRNLALMRSITILLLFITEFVFYEQVEANLGSDEQIARFLGLFLAGATLVMVVVTAVVSGRYISRFGVGVGLMTMPAGLLGAAVVLILYGTVIGIDRGFFVLAVAANVLNTVLANAIETPVGAVMYQPMPVEQRMPVRLAVDGWLGSAALLVVGGLLLIFQALDADTVLPFVWLLAAVGAAGVVVARRLYADYRAALDHATTLAFGGGSADGSLLADLEHGQGVLHAGLVGDDPGAAFALASIVQDFDEHPLQLVMPQLVTSRKHDIAALGVAAVDQSGDAAQAPRVAWVVDDEGRPDELRADALAVLHRLAPEQARRRISGVAPDDRSPLAAQSLALALSTDAGAAARVATLAASDSSVERRFAAEVLRRAPADDTLDSHLREALIRLLGDDDEAVVTEALAGAAGRADSQIAERLVDVSRNAAFRRPAVAALAESGGVAIDAIEHVLPTISETHLAELVDRVYGPNTRRPPLLHRFVAPEACSPVRRAGFEAVRTAGIDLPATVGRMVRDDVERAEAIVGAYRDFDRAGMGDLVATALRDEFDDVRRTIWSALRLDGSAGRLAELELVAATGSADQRANAIEALDSILSPAVRDLVLPVLEPASIDEAVELAAAAEPAANDAIDRLDAAGLTDTTRQLLHHVRSADQEPPMSQTLERVLALKGIDIFASLRYELLVELAGVVDERVAVAGEVVLTEGEIGDELFALTAGEVRVGSADVVLSAGTVFGELAVLNPGPRSATVTAVGEATMLVLSRPTLLALTDRHPAVMAEIARVLAERLQSSSGSSTPGR